MKKNNEGNFRTFWFRYDSYEMREIEEKHYITPKENSKVVMYDPFDVADDILVDILTIGRCVEKNDIEESNKMIMEFMNDRNAEGARSAMRIHILRAINQLKLEKK